VLPRILDPLLLMILTMCMGCLKPSWKGQKVAAQIDATLAEARILTKNTGPSLEGSERAANENMNENIVDSGDEKVSGIAPDSSAFSGALSSKSNLRMKKPAVFKSDIARALQLPESEICSELGVVDCFQAHNMALGGIDPFERGILEAQEEFATTAPIVLDRIALLSCVKRVDLDFADPSAAVIFKGLALKASAKSAGPDGPEMEQAIVPLYRELFQRNPKTWELTSHKDFYEFVDSKAEQRAKDWATLTCLTILTSVEAVFY
jgi:hypothetical protein